MIWFIFFFENILLLKSKRNEIAKENIVRLQSLIDNIFFICVSKPLLKKLSCVFCRQEDVNSSLTSIEKNVEIFD